MHASGAIYLDRDLERERDFERECRESSFEWAGECAGERLADLPERRGLALLDAERDSWINHTSIKLASGTHAQPMMGKKLNHRVFGTIVTVIAIDISCMFSKYEWKIVTLNRCSMKLQLVKRMCGVQNDTVWLKLAFQFLMRLLLPLAFVCKRIACTHWINNNYLALRSYPRLLLILTSLLQIHLFFFLQISDFNPLPQFLKLPIVYTGASFHLTTSMHSENSASHTRASNYSD